MAEVKENNNQLVCEIKIDAEIMRKIIDEKMAQIELDIQEIRNKAIDEFMNKLCDHCIEQENECDNRECPFCTYGCEIINIAEQMKGE